MGIYTSLDRLGGSNTPSNLKLDKALAPRPMTQPYNKPPQSGGGQSQQSWIDEQKAKFGAGNAGGSNSGYSSGGGSRGGGGSGGGAAAADKAAAVAYLNSQQSNLDRQMGRTGTTLEQGLTRLTNDYNSKYNTGSQNRARALEDLGIQH